MARKVITTPRDFPSVEELLQAKSLVEAMARLPRPIAASVIKETVASFKQRLKSHQTPIPLAELTEAVRLRLLELSRTEITPVINASGIVVHTNLGRAPLSPELFDAVRDSVVGYGNIEYDLASGQRGSRGVACENYLKALAGSEAATVVNNCAAALFIILNTLANRKEVIISRGELVQIGGGFRIPDILKRSGAKLVEVGATNITSLADYENAITARTALILKVHKSNFVQAGFTSEVELKDLVALGKKQGVPVVNDLGSGVLVPTKKTLGYREPTVQNSVRAGADLTCFSGDKLLGGVQAGLIVGSTELVARLKKNPIFRTVRVDKIVFAMLEKLLSVYLDGTHHKSIKLWHLLDRPVGDLRLIGERIIAALGHPETVSLEMQPAYVGGGALPEQSIPSVGLVISSQHKPQKLMRLFRESQPPVIGRIDNDKFILDLKAIDDHDVVHLTRSIALVLGLKIQES